MKVDNSNLTDQTAAFLIESGRCTQADFDMFPEGAFEVKAEEVEEAPKDAELLTAESPIEAAAEVATEETATNSKSKLTTTKQ